MVRRIALSILAALALGPAPAAAEPAPDPQVQAKVIRLVDSGSTAFEVGNYALAVRDFHEAYALFPSPKILFNVARAELALGHSAEAAEAFDEFVRREANDGSLDEAKVSFARNSLAELLSKGKVVRVDVEVEPNRATLTVDARSVRTRFYLARTALDAKHLLEGSAEGWTRAHLEFTLRDVLERPAPLRLVLTEATDANLANAARAKAATTETKPASESHAAKEAPEPNVEASPPSSSGRVPAYVTFGVAGALAVGAAGTGTWVLSQSRSLQGCAGASIASCANAGNASAVSLRTKARVADVLWIGAAAAAATGGVLFYLAPAGDGSGGEIGISGRF
ncbi:MAG: hypothetical protein JST54_06850 [Deltaproteobacteria bacterium]|nr:hypothetical protein [Deltaproteobacteria bacterium]